MSERKEIADRIAAFINENDLAQVFGGDVTLDNNMRRAGRHYSILLSRRATLDGVIRVFSRSSIQVYTVGPDGFGSVRFPSEEKALEFLRIAFVDGDRDAAHKLAYR